MNSLARIGLLACAPLIIHAQSFEVASIRENHGNVYRSGPLIVSEPLIRLRGYTIFGLVLDAFNVRDFQVKLAPGISKDAVLDTTYDIIARAPGDSAPPIDLVRAMLRNLLKDRFQLRTHDENRVMPVYILEVAKGGPELKASVTDAPCSLKTALARDGRNDDETFSGCPIERLADRLTNKIQRPVLDRTGLTGRYDMQLLAVPAFRSQRSSDPADIDPVTAVRQMGLKLTPRQEPVKIISIDQVAKPTEN